MLAEQASFDFGEEGRLEKKFWEFHVAHPEVYRTLVFFARQWRERRGSDAVCGIGALYERARWEMRFESLGYDDTPRLNNNHKAFYARFIMDRNPDLAGIFGIRQQRIQSTLGPDNTTLAPNTHIV